MTTPTTVAPPTQAPMVQTHSLYQGGLDMTTRRLYGLWLWCGVETRSDSFAQWQGLFRQAKSWGMSGIHFKVAEGTIAWYADAFLDDLRKMANNEGLIAAPYHFVYGDALGALSAEAQLVAHMGNIFGVVCPDMEDAWQTPAAHGWMARYGKIIRAETHDLVFPTVYANPLVHSFPYLEANTWVDGYLPQAYFDVWTTGGHRMSAKEASTYVFNQWLAEEHLVQSHGQPRLKPMLPIIATENLPSQEAVNWLEIMHGYGYCGYWYELKYPPVATAISHYMAQHKPVPARAPTPTPAPVVVAPKPERDPVVEPVAASHPAPAPAPSTVSQDTVMVPVVTPPPASPDPLLPLSVGPLSEVELLFVWHSLKETLPYDASHPMCQYWADLIQARERIGAPLAAPMQESHDGLSLLVLKCAEGTVYHSPESGGIGHIFSVS